MRYAMRIHLAVASRRDARAGRLRSRRRRAAPGRCASAPDLERMHADAPGIAWFKGERRSGVRSRRKASNKPVLLYWGAQWCPPCKQLKSAVFSRPDFIEKSKLFVAVYLDGDLPDAQKWGDVFRVTGYPTVVVLKSDRTEITRIAGNMDLSLYARVLDDALGDVRPVKDVIALATKAEAPLAAADCRRLAYHAFDLEDEGIFESAKLQVAFENAARLCPAELAKERARLYILAAARGRDVAERVHREGRQGRQGADGADPARQRSCWRTRNSRWRTPTRCAACPGSSTSPRARRCRRSRRACANASWPSPMPPPPARSSRRPISSPRSSEDPRGQGLCARRQGAHRCAHRGACRPRRRCWRSNRMPYVRAGVVNSAINIYIALDDWPRARDLLALEASTSNTPHYYIGDLADVEEHLGNNAARARAAGRGVPEGAGSGVTLPVGLPVSRWTAAPRARRHRDHREGWPRRDRASSTGRTAFIAARCRASPGSTRRCASGTPRRSVPPWSRNSGRGSRRPAPSRPAISRPRRVAAASARAVAAAG